ncbi:MAG: Fe-S cluster assembly ATPase SufC [Candidatus Micrarchaeota archaeon]|nr:Fe-S cluster assembly ATPase SufC [Candidatus Micrarchaeota archaeon]
MARKNTRAGHSSALEISSLRASVEGKEIIRGISMRVCPGEIHIVMGPNGSGKSTLACSLIGMPNYKTSGKILLCGEEISGKAMHERSRAGLFIAFQNPPEIESIRNSNLIRQAVLAHGSKESASEFKEKLEGTLGKVGLGSSFYGRPVNYGFSGGEKKKNELAQLLMLKPKFAVLDEVDSGLDIDSVKKAAHIIRECAGSGMGIILITHSPQILKFITPTRVYLLLDGKIAKEGGKELIVQLERSGFAELGEQPIRKRT